MTLLSLAVFSVEKTKTMELWNVSSTRLEADRSYHTCDMRCVGGIPISASCSCSACSSKGRNVCDPLSCRRGPRLASYGSHPLATFHYRGDSVDTNLVPCCVPAENIFLCVFVVIGYVPLSIVVCWDEETVEVR